LDDDALSVVNGAQVEYGNEQRSDVLDQRLTTGTLGRQHDVLVSVSYQNDREVHHVCAVHEHRQNDAACLLVWA